MPQVIRVLGPALLITVIAVGCASSPATFGTTGGVISNSVSIKGFAFNPAQVNVTKTGTVTWTNDDGTTHTVTSGVPGTPNGKFDQRVESGNTFKFTFTDAGTYEFFCSIHNSMRGTVTVK
jgi:plastocyanin